MKDVNNVVRGFSKTCGDKAHRLKPTVDNYSTAHGRLARERGSAKTHPCRFCSRPAEQWAYLHGDLDQRTDHAGKEAGMAFSSDPQQYVAACRGCHARFDRAHPRNAVGGMVSLAHHALSVALASS